MQSTINCNGKLLSLRSPLIMGIINLNDASFYSGSRSDSIYTTLQKTETMLSEGADIIDIGYMTSKPGSPVSDPLLEKEVINNTLLHIKKSFPEAIVSVDTLHSSVAADAVSYGADMINDISAGSYDSEMMHTVAKLNIPYIMMHMKGLPDNMQKNPEYTDVVLDILTYLKNKVIDARKAGIKDVIIDPGFGFGKTNEHNFSLLKHLGIFRMLDIPVLAGLSRKSMIWKTLGTTPEAALNGTSALNLYALQQGASILRVHDVREAAECVKLYNAIEMAP
ncbi:MAG TPA: dihydropteroate synthase [Saprospiraceae bacterium]|jgi:dihydropteroate synthase|nr:dihydropteroate synthase [Saprospiraceae bacterium]HRO08927.1 dihydropteroate synthase [Saprospiraceae bacterium]HRP42359.1 dihydropteroate synthase [Saprospiraceae bacterium]